MEIFLGKGDKLRLKRIQELKNCSEERAIELAISVAWLVYEKRANPIAFKEVNPNRSKSD
jgi:hypothetical protein